MGRVRVLGVAISEMDELMVKEAGRTAAKMERRKEQLMAADRRWAGRIDRQQ